jgi:hypothetical protein
MASWWVQVFYPAMDRLMGLRGTFEMCLKGEHSDPPLLALDPPPEGMFVDEREVDFDSDEDDEAVDLDDLNNDEDEEREAFDV